MNILFNASAGTGKTWQVTGLYSALALGRPHDELPPERRPVPLDRMLLMTFTDNAAAELRKKVAGKMLQQEKEALDAGDGEMAGRARRVLRTLPSAHISTIHAFCAGLVREHALDLGLSAGFQTIEEGDRKDLLEETLRKKIFQHLETDPAFREFCAGIPVLGDSESSLTSILRTLLEKAASRGLDLEGAESMLPPPVRTAAKEDFERIYEELRTFPLPSKAKKALDALKQFLDGFPNPDRLAAIPKFGQAKTVRHLSDELAELKERFYNEFFYEQRFDQFPAFARCLADCAKAFSDAKRNRDCVDFGDQLLLARDLLRSGEQKVPPFDWIIVDEVQDTSRVQCDIIEALWGPGTNLVICGDPKQSIYAWRSADPQVMPDLEARMEARSGLRRIALRKSYRSKDRVLQAANELFAGIGGKEYEAAALEPVEEINARTAPQGEGPCLEFLMPDSGESSTADEMAAVARRIRLLAEGGPGWRPIFGHDGTVFKKGEPVRYSDILILLKRSACQRTLEEALREEGVPFTSGGKGHALFEQQEVVDLLMFLQVLCEPFNGQALAGFLRSPFAGLTDETLAETAWNGETFSAEALRRRFFESGCEAAQRLLCYQGQTGEKTASQLARNLISDTGYDAILAGQPGGEQKLANMKKTIDWLRAAERGGTVLLPDVVRRFEQAVRTPPGSGAAEALLPDPEQNSVTIMTVHGAKGLSWRVCFIPDISFGLINNPGTAVFSSENRLEMNVSGPGEEKIKSPGWDAACEADRAVRSLEQTNVFYVAMTRARDLTVLSGAGTKNPMGWLKQAGGFLKNASPEILCRRSFSEIPKAGVSLPADRTPPPEIRYEPLTVPAGITRKTVTSLLPDKKETARSGEPGRIDPRLYGTLGHAVLEELARKHWNGSVCPVVEALAAEAKPPAFDTETLVSQLEAARDFLAAKTEGAISLRAEFPFVYRNEGTVFDGTIDLLAEMPSGELKIIDYKFTEEPEETLTEHYTPQLQMYCKAVCALYPGKKVSAVLFLIGSTLRALEIE